MKAEENIRAPGRAGIAEPRVLLVSYNYPPVATIGAVRTTKLARYLPGLGWPCTVLTVAEDRTKWGKGNPDEGRLPGVRVIRARFPDALTAARDLLVGMKLLKPARLPDEPGAAGEIEARCAAGRLARRLFGWARRWVSFPDRYLMWLPSAVLAGRRELARGEYGVIFSTSPPVTDHMVAAVLKALAGLPWVADLRDPWQHPYLEPTRLQAFLNGRLEKLVLKRADAIVTVSEPLAERTAEFHGRARDTVLCITNGFDPAEHEGEAASPPTRFTITYTGALFNLRQDPEEVLRAIDEMVESGRAKPGEIVVRFYGPREPGLERLAGTLRHPEIVEVMGVVPRREALQRQRESTALLVLLWDTPYTAGIYGGKVLEYLGARRPVLAWNPAGGIIAGLLERTNAGVAVRDRAGLLDVLTRWLDEFHQTGALAFEGNDSEIDRYRWESIAGAFSHLFDSLTSTVRGRLPGA